MDRPSHAPKQSAAENGSACPPIHQLPRGRPRPRRCQQETECPARAKRATGWKKSMCGGAPTLDAPCCRALLLAALFTLATLAGALYLGIQYELNPLALRYSAYAVAGAVWVAQLGRWGYHVLTFSYRLTTRRLLLERSFFNSARAALDLRRLARVEVDRQPLERLVGVGRIRIFEEGRGVPSLELRGLLHAERVAGLIRDQAKRAVETSRLH